MNISLFRFIYKENAIMIIVKKGIIHNQRKENAHLKIKSVAR